MAPMQLGTPLGLPLPALSPGDAAAPNLAEVVDFSRAPNLTALTWDVPLVVGAQRTV